MVTTVVTKIEVSQEHSIDKSSAQDEIHSTSPHLVPPQGGEISPLEVRSANNIHRNREAGLSQRAGEYVNLEEHLHPLWASGLPPCFFLSVSCSKAASV
jgi:hypothetical protein